MSEIPASVQNITPACRQNRGDMGALEEALLRIERAYLTYKDAPDNDRVTWRISLVRVEPDEMTESSRGWKSLPGVKTGRGWTTL